MKYNKKKILRVGFDLDGVLLYNPARIFRPLIVLFKRIFIPQEKLSFHYPKTDLQKFIWFLIHKSSVFPAQGIEEIKELVRQNKIEAYIVSARYESLRSDFNYWLEKIEARKYFTGTFHNNNDEQPHIFKEKMIKKLRLDIFIEDNWDIIKYITSKKVTRECEIIWITNLLDRGLPFPRKFTNLKSVVSYIRYRIFKVSNS